MSRKNITKKSTRRKYKKKIQKNTHKKTKKYRMKQIYGGIPGISDWGIATKIKDKNRELKQTSFFEKNTGDKVLATGFGLARNALKVGKKVIGRDEQLPAQSNENPETRVDVVQNVKDITKGVSAIGKLLWKDLTKPDTSNKIKENIIKKLLNLKDTIEKRAIEQEQKEREEEEEEEEKKEREKKEGKKKNIKMEKKEEEKKEGEEKEGEEKEGEEEGAGEDEEEEEGAEEDNEEKKKKEEEKKKKKEEEKKMNLTDKEYEYLIQFLEKNNKSIGSSIPSFFSSMKSIPMPFSNNNYSDESISTIDAAFVPKSYKNYTKNSVPDERMLKETESDENIFIITDTMSTGKRLSSNVNGVDNLLANILYECAGPGCSIGVSPKYKITQKVSVRNNK